MVLANGRYLPESIRTWRYPRSFLGLCLAGFMLVAVPLVGALAYSAWHTERLAEQSRNAVFNASQAARASRTLVNRIGSIERLAHADDDAGRARAAGPRPGARAASCRWREELLQLPLEEEQLARAEEDRWRRSRASTTC